MTDSNSFLYSYEYSDNGDGTIAVNLASEAPLSIDGSGNPLPVALAEDSSPATLSAPETGYFEGTSDGTTDFTYLGRFAQGSTEVVVARVASAGGGFSYFVYSSDQLTDSDLNPSDGFLTTNYTSSDYVLCFLRGTLISTTSGEQMVEDLNVGDEVIANDGSVHPIRWIGKLKRLAVLDPQARPVRISRGALGDVVPASDLFVSPDHALFVSGYMITARSMINGSSINWADDCDPVVEYFHIELDSHQLILANGALAESYLDEVPRAAFDNWEEWENMGLQVMTCEPLPYLRVKSRRQLPRSVSEHLIARAGQLDQNIAQIPSEVG